MPPYASSVNTRKTGTPLTSNHLILYCYTTMPIKVIKRIISLGFIVIIFVATSWSTTIAKPSSTPPLWQIYQQSLKSAKYVDLTHTITPTIAAFAQLRYGESL